MARRNILWLFMEIHQTRLICPLRSLWLFFSLSSLRVKSAILTHRSRIITEQHDLTPVIDSRSTFYKILYMWALHMNQFTHIEMMVVVVVVLMMMITITIFHLLYSKFAKHLFARLLSTKFGNILRWSPVFTWSLSTDIIFQTVMTSMFPLLFVMFCILSTCAW